MGTSAHPPVSSRSASKADQSGPTYWSDVHKLGFERLCFATTSSAPLTLFVGQIGTGRTRLVSEVISGSPLNAAIRTLFNPHHASADIVSDVVAAFDPNLSPVEDPEQNRLQLKTLLSSLDASGRSAVLIVDDADRLSTAQLDVLCSLTDLDTETEAALKLILVGRPGLTNILLNERPDIVGPTFSLEGMGEDDVRGYVRARMAATGAGDIKFTKGAMSEIVAQTSGIPKRINIICDGCLNAVSKEALHQIERAHVRKVAALASIRGPSTRATNRPPLPTTGRTDTSKQRVHSDTNRPHIGSEAVALRATGQKRKASTGGLSTLKTVARVPTWRGRKTTLTTGAVFLLGATIVLFGTGSGVPLQDRFASLKGAVTTSLQSGRASFASIAGRDTPDRVSYDPEAVALAGARVVRISASLGQSEPTASGQYLAALDLAETAADAAVVGFARAALSGHERSAYYLGQIYETGEGVPVDLVLAKAWYKMAGSEIAGAVNRLMEMQTSFEAGTMSAPEPLFSKTVPGGAVELVWTSGDGPDPSFYRVELSRPGGELSMTVEPVTISAIRLTAPENALQWRVIAVDKTTGDRAASPWIPIDPT